ncbi:hypothetical protein PVA44_02720 [Entomospira nematocerorum]|uniref:Uncharacterized protein n=1 Tax=Entomospira nematocerorum TaxID=2719987 RepID=A0A968GDG7_9SPIO|nr:hypothetical protein [Entomospira nematocera]NIZ47052.1 hypothetical protein [Entomospira nematocera]WDI34403.1 hypothetical protein PVA44_02720 [Entomospira nematocera]
MYTKYLLLLLIIFYYSCKPQVESPSDIPLIPIENPSKPSEDVPLTPLDPSNPIESPSDPGEDVPLTPLDPSNPIESPSKPSEDVPLTPLDPSNPIENPSKPSEDVPLTPLDPSNPIENPSKPSEDIPLTPLEPSYPIEKEHIITTNLVGNPLSAVRVRGYIIPKSNLGMFVGFIQTDTEIVGGEQSKGLTMSQYERITGTFSNLYRNSYNLNYLASGGYDDYMSGGNIEFNFDTHTLTIEGVIQSFDNINSLADIFLTKDKTWSLQDVKPYLESIIVSPPKIGSQYYILWILESKTYSVAQDKMYIRLLSQDESDTPLYTITH